MMSIKRYHDGEFLPLNDYKKPAPRRSNMVMLYRWYAVAVCILAVVALWSKLA